MRYPLSARLLALLLFLPFLAACDSAEPDTPSLSAFFGPATATEINTVISQWESTAASGAYDAGNVEVLFDQDVLGDGGRVLIYSHTTGSSTDLHYAMARVPAGDGPFPVIVYNHGGDNGFNFETELSFVADPEQSPFGAIAAQSVFVFPTFRAEPLRNSPIGELVSGGDDNPWDGDVADAFASLDAALSLIPQADGSRIGTIGVSRGATVSMLMGIRPIPASASYSEVRAVVNYFGFTDFIDAQSSRLLGIAVFNDDPRVLALPGVPFLKETVLDPYRDGLLPLAEARLEGVRRSPAYFADRLPPTISHHHRRDGVVPFDQYQALQNRESQIPVSQFYAYGEAGEGAPQFHTFAPDVMPQNLERTAQFLMQHLFGATPS